MRNEANFSGILREVSEVVSAGRREIGIFVLVIGGITALGVALGLTETSAGLYYGFYVDSNDTLGSGLFEVFAGIVSIVATYLLLKALLATRGRAGDGRNRFWEYLGMSILSLIAIGIGSLLLLVPGIILAIRWSASSGFLISRGEGVIDSLKASWHATKGHGWAIFFAAVVLGLGLLIVVGILAGLFALLGALVAGVISSFLEAFLNAVMAAFGVAIYCLVSDDARDVGEVFS